MSDDNKAGEIIALSIFMASAYFGAGVVFSPQIVKSPTGGLGDTLIKIFFLSIGVICLIAIWIKAESSNNK